MLEQKCKKHWITFTNTYAGTVVLEQSEQFEFFSDIPSIGIGICIGIGIGAIAIGIGIGIAIA